MRRLIEPPRDLVGEELAAPLVDSVIDLLARATPDQWPLEHDHMVLLNASVLLGAPKQVEARWDRYLAAVSTRLRARLKHSQASSWPKPSAPAILRASGDQELPSPGLVVTPPSVPRPLAVFEAASEVPPRWVLLFALRWTTPNPRSMPEKGCAFCAGRACCRTISSCVAVSIA